MNLILLQNEKSWALFRLFNQFQLSVEFHTETCNLICNINRMTRFYMKCNTGVKWVESRPWQTKFSVMYVHVLLLIYIICSLAYFHIKIFACVSKKYLTCIPRENKSLWQLSRLLLQTFSFIKTEDPKGVFRTEWNI